MTTHHTDEKKPAQGGIDEQVETRRPMLPSSARCIWVGPQTEQEQWSLKEQVERALQRLDKALWSLDSSNLDNPAARLEIARSDIILAMDQALAVEALLFECRPEDEMRQSATWHFDSCIKR